MQVKNILQAGIALLFAGTAQAQSPQALPSSWGPRLHRVEAYVEAQRVARRIPGMTVGITAGSGEWVHGFGLADLENGTKTTAKSAYRIASVTKPMTAIAILRLAEQKKIDLDAEIQQYVPYFPRKTWPVTVRDLLSHQAGITDYQSAAEESITEHKTTRQAIAIFEERPLVFEPRSEFYYTSYGYALLGAAIEEVTGKSYDSYMRAMVWDPLGMQSITMDDPAIVMPNRVRGYRMENGRIMNSEFVDVSSRGAAGATRGTVPDLLAFGRGMYERKLLAASSYDVMWSERRTNSGRATGYGLGWDIGRSDAGLDVVGHTGSQQETATVLHVYPSRRLAIAIAANLERADVSAIARGVFELITGEAAAPPPYLRAPDDRAAALAMLQRAFVAGRAHFERIGSRASADISAVRDSFGRVNRQLTASDGRDNARAVHPSDDDLKAVGAFVAEQLHARLGSRGLTAVSGQGPIGFFAAWVSASRSGGTTPQWARLDSAIENRLLEWSADWKVTMPPATALQVVPVTDIAAPLAELRRRAANRSVYPDLSGSLTEVVQAHSLAGRHDAALAIGAAIEELYPGMSNPSAFHGAYGLALVAAGRESDGFTYLRRAHARNAGGLTASARLVRIAGDYAHNGMLAAARAILGLASELHPRSAAVRFQLGEVLYRSGDVKGAAAAYREALALNPAFVNAGEARERLRKIDARSVDSLAKVLETKAAGWLAETSTGASMVILKLPFAASASLVHAQSRKSLATTIEEYARKNSFNGTVLVKKDGKTIVQRSFGLADRAFSVPFSPSTKLKIASITKLFTSVLILQLCDEGLLDLHAPIKAYLPDYQGEGGERVTLHNLLNHTSGIRNSDQVKSYEEAATKGIEMYQLPHTPADLLSKYASGNLVHEVGKVFDYNNADYIILGVIAERVTGKPYADLLKARILDPTGMTGSGVLSQSRILTGLAPTYMRAREGEPLINDMPVYPENWYAAGAMYSTSADLARFAEALFASRLLKTESLRLMLTPGLDDYGYGTWISAQNVQGRNHHLPTGPDRSWVRMSPSSDISTTD
jgi:CubicO group peptidase (beta-lactamase class C family)